MWVLLVGCNNKPVRSDVPPAVVAMADSVFVLAKYKMHFRFKNNLSAIPFAGNAGKEKDTAFVLDSIMLKSVYQGVKYNYALKEDGGGNQFYGYCDTFKNFDAICMYTGRGDGGDLYDLLTFTKSGKRISRIEAAWLQGEEDEWNYNETAQISRSEIIVRASACHAVDSARIVCDTLVQFYRFTDNGEIVLVKRDSVLNVELDSIRRVRPYN
jgi:hypothetical protein